LRLLPALTPTLLPICITILGLQRSKLNNYRTRIFQKFSDTQLNKLNKTDPTFFFFFFLIYLALRCFSLTWAIIWRQGDNSDAVIEKISNNLEEGINLRNSVGTIKTKGFEKWITR